MTIRVNKKKKKRFVEKLRNRYRLIIYNDTTFQSVWSIKLSRLKVFTVTSLSTAFLVAVVIILIVVTPLKEYIPGYPKKEYRQMLIRNKIMVDSLENELTIRDIFFQNIKTIIEGGTPVSSIKEGDTGIHPGEIVFQEYNHDSVFMDKILEEQLNLSVQPSGSRSSDLSKVHFFTPVRGVVSNKFKSTAEHNGVDLVSSANSLILSTLDGTILFAGWTLETGNVLYIQHENNLVSVYKHNAELLKKEGDKVKAGEAIAIIGNSGELSTGPHLHFELWHNGVPLDPELYIEF